MEETRRNNFIDSPYVKDFVKCVYLMYEKGWDERSAGNLSLLLREEELTPYLDTSNVIRTIPFNFDASSLKGLYFLVSATGSFFRTIKDDPERYLGLMRIGESGREAELIWGYKNGGNVTSEFASHLMGHQARLRANPKNRIIMHGHPQNIIAMSLTHSLDEKEFTRTLWSLESECIVIFPEGVAVLPWMVFGTKEIGEATAKKLEEFRLVVWPMHGIYSSGCTFDDVFSLIEVVDKAASLYIKTKAIGIKNQLGKEELRMLVDHFGVKVKQGWLD